MTENYHIFLFHLRQSNSTWDELLIFKYPNKKFLGYFNLKSCNNCKSGAWLLKIKASVCVSLDVVYAFLKTIQNNSEIVC